MGRLLIWLVSLRDALIPGPSPPDRRGHLSPQLLGAVITASSLMRPSQESSAVHRHKSAAGIRVSPPRWPSPSLPTPSHPSRLPQSPGFEAPESCSEFPRAVCFMYGAVYISTPLYRLVHPLFPQLYPHVCSLCRPSLCCCPAYTNNFWCLNTKAQAICLNLRPSQR